MSFYKFLVDDEHIPCSQVPADTQSRKYGEFSDISSEEEGHIMASCDTVEQQYRQVDGKAGTGGDVATVMPAVNDIRSISDQAVRFADPMTEEEMSSMTKKFVPKNTQKSIKWACRVFEEWRVIRNMKIKNGDFGEKRLSVIDIKLENLHDDELNFCLSRFICEARREDGNEYPPKTLRQLVLLIQMHLNELGRNINLLSDSMFKEVKNTLDNAMKKGTVKGLGIHPRQASVISLEQEEQLWSLRLLGAETPQTLVDTMVFLIGLNFALRSGEEHRSLTLDQLETGSNEQGEYLRYREKISKNNQGGLNNVKSTPKVVTAYAVPRPERSIVNLFRRYISVRPANAPEAFYLRPLNKPKGDVWYYSSPIGKDTLAKTIQRVCEAAGFKGFFTNHSLRATCATRLFHEGVDEQLIARTTGHRSNAIRHYKRVTDDQDLMVSSVVQGAKRQCPGSAQATHTGPKSLQFTVNVKLA